MTSVHVVFFDKASTQRRLIGRHLPCHVEDAFLRPDVPFRMAMALQTPAHREWLLLPHQCHVLHRSVTGGAANAIGDVDAVVEKNVVR